LSRKYQAFVWLLTVWLLGAGCASAPMSPLPPEQAPQATAPPESGTPDQIRLREALTGRELSPGEVASLSDRLLASGNEVSDQDMARLELLLLKALKGPDKAHHAVLWRNLGIIHYHQKKYQQARQELQASNEMNPKNARTHYYLARLFVQQGEIYERRGKKRISKQQFKRAAIEMEQARKIEPSNPLYRQDPREIIRQEQGI
jgi:tetratricopeptide (TPR) repeat protein